MATESKRTISADWWAVIVSLGAALLIKAGFLPRIPW
jgi:hypothetical protein